MDEWKNGWMNEWMNEWMNKWINEIYIETITVEVIDTSTKNF